MEPCTLDHWKNIEGGCIIIKIIIYMNNIFKCIFIKIVDYKYEFEKS